MTIKNGSVTNVEPNNIPYRVLPRVNVKSNTGSGARLIPIMTKRRRDTLSQQQIDCILQNLILLDILMANHTLVISMLCRMEIK